MPRPKFSPDVDQRRTLDALASLARRRARLDDEMDRLIGQAAEQDIPVTVIAQVAGRQRKTIYRHLGYEM